MCVLATGTGGSDEEGEARDLLLLRSRASRWGASSTGGGDDHWAHIDSYRNHWRMPKHQLSASTGFFTFEDELLQHSGEHPDGFDISDDAPAEVNPVDHASETSGLLDAENHRIGGPDPEHGCEMVFAGD
jgi:hypothetical protein